MSPWSSGVLYAWKRKTPVGNFQFISSIPREKTVETDTANFRCLCAEDIAAVEDIAQVDIFWYNIDIIEGSNNGVLAQRSFGKHFNDLRLLRYNSRICHFSKINACFKAYPCPSSDQFIKKAFHLEQHLVICRERLKLSFPKIVYQLGETLFDKLDSLNFPNSDDQKLFKIMAIFDFESICAQEDKFPDTYTTTWIDKHVPLSVSISSKFI